MLSGCGPYHREEEAIKLDGLSVAEMKQLRDQSEKFAFQAEVNRMMKLIINSLYRNKEVRKGGGAKGCGYWLDCEEYGVGSATFFLVALCSKLGRYPLCSLFSPFLNFTSFSPNVFSSFFLSLYCSSPPNPPLFFSSLLPFSISPSFSSTPPLPFLSFRLSPPSLSLPPLPLSLPLFPSLSSPPPSPLC